MQEESAKPLVVNPPAEINLQVVGHTSIASAQEEFVPREPSGSESYVSFFKDKYEKQLFGDIVFDDDWNTGEGGFRWLGRSSRTARPNTLTVDWTNHTLSWYLAEFTNLNNDFWAHPSFLVEYIVQRPDGRYYLAAKGCITMVDVPDEDLGNEPTFFDVRARSVLSFSRDIVCIQVVPAVWWSYFSGSSDCRTEFEKWFREDVFKERDC